MGGGFGSIIRRGLTAYPGSGFIEIPLAYTKIVPTVYYTQGILHTTKAFSVADQNSPNCSGCQETPADPLHMLWKCSVLSRNRKVVVDTIKRVFQMQIVKDPLVCILSNVEEELYPPEIRILKWISLHSPSFVEYQTHNIPILPRKHMIFQDLHNLWEPYLSVPGLAPLSLVTQNLFQS